MIKLVSNQICPNLILSDALHGLKYIFQARSQQSINFSSYFGTENYFLTNAARTALSIIVRTVRPDTNKKIGIPAFMCAVAAVPFIEAGYEIKWIDTDHNGLIDFNDFKQKSDQIGLLVCPHVFGQLVDLKPFYEHCQSKNIFLVEDCAHAWEIGSKIEYADARILSFGREKVYSCVSGGALLWNDNSEYARDFSHIQLPLPLATWTLKHLLQPLIFGLALPWWSLGGKIIPYFAQKTKLLPLAVSQSEKQGNSSMPKTTLPYPLQRILQRQFKQSERVITHRKKMAQKWRELFIKNDKNAIVITSPNNLRVILKTNQAQQILSKAKAKNFYLRDWDGVPLSPANVDYEKFGYTPGQCPNAEKFAESYVTFPTNIRTTIKDIEYFENNL